MEDRNCNNHFSLAASGYFDAATLSNVDAGEIHSPSLIALPSMAIALVTLLALAAQS